MDARDWATLIFISAIVSVCGVLGVSYVLGKGWPSLDLPRTIAFILLFTGVAMVVIFFAEVGIAKVSARFRNFADVKESPANVGEIGRNVVVRERATYAPMGERMKRVKPEKLQKQMQKQMEKSAKAGHSRKHVRLPGHIARVLAVMTPKWAPLSILFFAAIMFITWTPWLIANYPGGTYWDTYYQMYQVYPENHPIAIIPWAEIYDQTLTDAWLVDHHPIFTTLVYGAFAYVSDMLTGNWMAGVFLFVCLQGLAHTIAFSGAVAYMRERGCPLVLVFASYAFFCIMPFISTWALCMVKDSFFGLFCVPYFIMLFEAVRTRGASFRLPRTVLLFTLCSLMLCLTKKTGLFVIVPTALIGAIVYKQRKPKRSKDNAFVPEGVLRESFEEKRGIGTRISDALHSASFGFLVSAIVPSLVMLVIFPYVLFPALNIEKGGTQEALGPMLQQTARYMVDYPKDITPAESAAIDAIIDYPKLASEYKFDFQDSVKYRYKLDATPQQLLDYLVAYVRMGVRHPDSYFGSIMCLAGYYVAPTAYANLRMVTVDTKMGETQRYMLFNPTELKAMRTFMDDAYKALGETPGVNLPLLIVTYAFWLPAILLYCMWRRSIKCGTLFIPALVLLGFCIIAPVYDARYAVPIFDMAPLYVCAMAVLLRKKFLGSSFAPAYTFTYEHLKPQNSPVQATFNYNIQNEKQEEPQWQKHL